MTTQYRIFEDQANVGLHPDVHPMECQGYYHGKVYVVRSWNGEIADGWEYVAAFAQQTDADEYVVHRLDMQRPARRPRAKVGGFKVHGDAFVAN